MCGGLPDSPPKAPPVLPDILRQGLRIVFCGTAAGAVSAARGAYYAGPGNRFWSILHRIGLTPRQLQPEEFPLLPQFGIGLTDIAKHVSGADSDLPANAFDPTGLAARIRTVRPEVLAFNGKKAASLFLGLAGAQISYGHAVGPDDFPAVFVLPSTSGAARGNWDEGPWFELARRQGQGLCPWTPSRQSLENPILGWGGFLRLKTKISTRGAAKP
jgi:double-stranded uracil-DNA glycosylase